MNDSSLRDWLREQFSDYSYDLKGIFRFPPSGPWPVQVADESEFEKILIERGCLLPLPKEPAALANVLEVSIVDFILERLDGTQDASGVRGTERGYPDIEVSGSAFGKGYHAVDVKVAQRKIGKRGKVGSTTQSRITLYTGNTYFRYPTLHWPGTFRQFDDYSEHLDIVVLYTLDAQSPSRVNDLEILVHEPWRIASKQRSSTTREYIGAVTNIDDLRSGRGDFDTPEAFYRFWRKHPFKVGAAVQQQLDKLLAEKGAV